MRLGGRGYTVMPGPTFDQCFVAKDRDTLIEQSLTLSAMFMKPHNFNTVNTTLNFYMMGLYNP